jgi:hypothetical protein
VLAPSVSSDYSARVQSITDMLARMNASMDETLALR